MRTIAPFSTLVLVLLGSLQPLRGWSAEPLAFPWGAARHAVPAVVQESSAIGYGVLDTTLRHHSPSALPVQPLPPKAGYAYGWFGSNPHSKKNSQWGRHFGIQQSYTQWSLR